MASGKFISYLRVSTAAQGKSGLGIDAQREAVNSFLNGGRWELLEEYVEVESGKKDDRERPQLGKALHHCKITGATLVIAKLDRLARDAHFLLGLQKAGVKFQAADMPEANEMVVGIMAVIAQGERKMISERTKAALAAAKARGTKLGNPNGAAHLRGLGNAKAVETIKANAQRRAIDVFSTIEDLKATGITSARQLAKALNDRGILTPRGGKWHPASVLRVMQRADGV
jgi:DNA invertase Pin-like site-specific DNA recombinase